MYGICLWIKSKIFCKMWPHDAHAKPFMSTFLIFPLILLFLGYLLGSLPEFGDNFESMFWLGVLGVTGLWLYREFKMGRQFIVWLYDQSRQAPQGWGIFGDLAQRLARIFRNHNNQLNACKSHLEQFLEAIQASPNGVLMLDQQSRITWCNTMATQHLGIDLARDMAQSIGNLIRDPDFGSYLLQPNHDHPVIIDGRQHRVSRPQRLSVQLFSYGVGQRLLLTQEITAIEQSEAMRRDFVANVSFEIRAPLSKLVGYIETLQSLDLAPEQQRVYLKIMAQEIQGMESLVSDLLTLSQLESGPIPGMEITPLSELWRSLKSDAHTLDAEMSGFLGGLHRLEFVPPEVPNIDCLGRGSELRVAMFNLVANALRYSRAEGQVCVSWRIGGQGEGIFTVSDNGPGIDPKHLPRLAERFYRADRSHSKDAGGSTGLGLAIVKHVAHRHGGELQIDSLLGHGSKFSIVLPAHRIVVH